MIHTIGGGSGGGGGDPTFIIGETEQRGDAIALTATLNEQEQRADALVFTPTFTETEQRGDAFLLPEMSFTISETEQRADLTTIGPITLYAQMRNIVIDSSAAAHHGTLVGAPTKVTGSGGFSTAISTSDGNYASVPTHADFDFNVTNKTIECRVKTTDAGTVLMGIWHVTDVAQRQWTMGINAAKAFFAFHSSDNSQVNLSSSASFNDGVEHVLRLTKNGTAITLLVDGTSVATHTIAAGVKAMPSFPLTIGQIAGTFADGAGTFDEVRISDIVRSDSTATPFVSDANTNILLHFDEPISTSFDLDEWGDAWTDNTIGQTTANHGNQTPLALAVGVAGIGVNIGWAEINLTRFTGLTAVGSAHTITCVASNSSLLVAATITLSGGPSAIGGGATRPFTESTITQSNQPATPTAFVLTANLAANASNVTLTFTLTNAQMQTIIGKWATLRFSSSGGTVATPDTIVSREGSVANRMKITFTGQV